MNRLSFLLLAALAGCGTVGQAPGGGPGAMSPDTVYLIVRSDDAGMSHAVNMANLRLFESGLPVSVSIMTPTPWWLETAELLRQHPDVSVGIHLTLNSEWKDYRWGPVIGQAAAPSLVDEDGYFFPSAQDLYDNHPDPGEVEAELRAQIERALDAGLQVDYVDFHMGAVSSHPPFLEIARRLAAEYGLLMSGFNDEAMASPQYRAEPADKPDSLAAMVARMASRYNVVITHPGLHTPELAALIDMNTGSPLADMASHRQGELDALLSDEFRRALRDRPAKLITYRDLRAMRPPETAPPAPAPTTGPATWVFVHGAWGGAWDWRTVDSLLTAAGHRVHRVQLTGLGERVHLASPDIGLDTHIQDVVNTLRWEELDDVVLVGHSYGGMVITGAADRASGRVRRLVYLDALLPRSGESLLDIIGDRGAALREGTDGFLRPGWVPADAPVPRDEPQPLRTFTDTLRLTGAADGVPGTYILTVAPDATGPDDFQPFADRAAARGWPVIRMEADHIPERSAPRELVRILRCVASGAASCGGG